MPRIIPEELEQTTADDLYANGSVGINPDQIAPGNLLTMYFQSHFVQVSSVLVAGDSADVTAKITAAATNTAVKSSPNGLGILTTGSLASDNSSTATQNYKVQLRDSSNYSAIDDGTGNEVYGVLSNNLGIWNLNFYKQDGTPFSFLSQTIDFLYGEVFDIDSIPGNSALLFGSFDRAINALAILQNKGDILSYDGSALGSLAVGTNGQVLTVDSSSVLGIKWSTNIGDYQNRISVSPSNDIRVGKAYTKIKDACDYIQSFGSASSTNKWFVEVFPGQYTESPYTIPEYTFISGKDSIGSTHIITNNNSSNFITLSNNSGISNCYITGPTSAGFAALNFDNGGTSVCSLIKIVSGYYGIWAHGNSLVTKSNVYAIDVTNEIGGTTPNCLFRATNYSSITATNCGPSVGNFSSGYGFYCEGQNAELNIKSSDIHSDSGTCIYADNGAIVTGSSLIFSSGNTAIYSGSGLNQVNINISDSNIKPDTFTYDIRIDNPNCIFSYSGVADRSKLLIVTGAQPIMSYIDRHAATGGQAIVGELQLGQIGKEISVGALLSDVSSTGWVSGGELSRNVSPSLNIDVSSGEGWINDLTQVKNILWNSATVTCTNNSTNYIYIDSSSVVSVSTTFPNIENNIIIGIAEANGGDIVFLSKHIIQVMQKAKSFYDFTVDITGNAYVSGLSVIKSGSPSLQFNVDGGVFYNHETRTTVVSSATPCVHYVWYKNGSGGWNVLTAQTSINPNLYDDGSGTLAAVPAGKWTKHLVHVNYSNDSTEFHRIIPQTYYDLQIEAETGGLPNVPGVFSDGITVAGIVVEQGASDITSIIDEKRSLGQSGSGGTNVTTHSDLSGLTSPADDHTQYALLSGSSGRNYVTGTFDFSIGELVYPKSSSPIQTDEGSVVWDTTNKWLTVGDSITRKRLINSTDTFGGDLSGSILSPSVNDLTMLGELRGCMIYYNGTKWVVLQPLLNGSLLTSGGVGNDPLWATAWTLVSGTLDGSTGSLVVPKSDTPSQTNSGSIVWDSDDNLLTIGTGISRKTIVDTDSSQSLSSKTLLTPTIASFTNASHNHQNASGGGQLDHGASMIGLSDDDHTQYALLAGRTSGQSLVGGTSASENLTLESTSNVTKGSVRISSGSDLDIVSGNFKIAGVNVFEADRQFAVSLIPNSDNALDLGSSSNRIRDIYVTPGSLKVISSAGDTQPIIKIGNSIDFGVGGSTAPDVSLFRDTSDKLSLADGDTFSIRTSLELRQSSGNYTISWDNPAASRIITFTDPGGNDSVLYANSNQTLANKTLTTPTIASFVNSAHNHQNAAGGGQLDHGLALTGLTDDDHTQYILATGTRSGSTTQSQSFGTLGIKADIIAEHTVSNGVQLSGIRHYGSSATNPTSPSPAEGDRYYNTTLEMEMRYDGSRSKWLSVESSVFEFGRLGNTNSGSFYRGSNTVTFSATSGYTAPFNGTVVSIGYSRADSDSATFEILSNGVTNLGTLLSASTSGSTNSINGDFSSGNILNVRNQGPNITTDVIGWVRVKWRI